MSLAELMAHLRIDETDDKVLTMLASLSVEDDDEEWDSRGGPPKAWRVDRNVIVWTAPDTLRIKIFVHGILVCNHNCSSHVRFGFNSAASAKYTASEHAVVVKSREFSFRYDFATREATVVETKGPLPKY